MTILYEFVYYFVMIYLFYFVHAQVIRDTLNIFIYFSTEPLDWSKLNVI